MPSDEEQIVTVVQQSAITGRVVDASTQEPIPRYKVTGITVFREDFNAVDKADQHVGENGQFSLPLASSS